MPVSDIARMDPIAATPDATIAEVASLMRDEQVGSIVVEEDGRPVGIVTDRDVAVKIVAEGKSPKDMHAKDVMTADPVTIQHDAGVFELTEVMYDNEVRRIPVVDGEELVGIVTLDDLDRLLSDEQKNLAGVIEAESPPY